MTIILNEFGRPFAAADFKNATLREPDQWLIDWIRDGSATTSGQAVNESSCLRASTVYACVRNIADDLGKLPFYLYERLRPRGKQQAWWEPLFKVLLHRPNSEMSGFTFRQTLTKDVALGGNGYAEIVRDGAGNARELWPIPRTMVTPRRTTDGRIIYEVRHPQYEEPEYLREDQMFHLRGIGDGLVGWSPIRIARESIGIALAQDKYNGASMGNDSTPGGIVNVKHDMSDPARIRFREEWEGMHRGTENRRRIAILRAEEAAFQQVEMNPVDAQFVERLDHSAIDICRWWRMPPHKIHQLADSNNAILEQQNTEYVVDCLASYFSIWEGETERKLIPANRPELYAAYDANAMMRGDSAARTAYYRGQFSLGAMSPNEIAEEEGRNPEDGGDDRYLQAGFIPLSIASKGPQPAEQSETDPIDPKKPSGRPEKEAESIKTPAPEDEMDNRIKDVVAAHRSVVASSLRNVLSNESRIIESKSRKADFGNWAKDFYSTQAEYVSSTIGPSLEALSVSVWAVSDPKTPFSAVKTAVLSEIGAVSERIVTRSKQEMREPSVVRNWSGQRADEDAADACERVAQAVGFAAMKHKERLAT